MIPAEDGRQARAAVRFMVHLGGMEEPGYDP